MVVASLRRRNVCTLMSRIGIGVIGIGVAAANAHLPVLTASQDFELLGIMDRDPARLEYAKGRWPIQHAYTELDALLAQWRDKCSREVV